MIVSLTDNILGVATFSVYLHSGEFYNLNLFCQALLFPAKGCLTFLASFMYLFYTICCIPLSHTDCSVFLGSSESCCLLKGCITKTSGKVQAAALFVAHTADTDLLSAPVMLQSNKPGQHLLLQPLTSKMCRNARTTCARVSVHKVVPLKLVIFL